MLFILANNWSLGSNFSWHEDLPGIPTHCTSVCSTCTYILYNGTQGIFAFRIYSREYETCTRGVSGVYNGETYWLQSAIIPPPSLPQPPPALICPNSHRGVFNHLIKNFGPGLKDKADAIASWPQPPTVCTSKLTSNSTNTSITPLPNQMISLKFMFGFGWMVWGNQDHFVSSKQFFILTSQSRCRWSRWSLGDFQRNSPANHSTPVFSEILKKTSSQGCKKAVKEIFSAYWMQRRHCGFCALFLWRFLNF